MFRRFTLAVLVTLFWVSASPAQKPPPPDAGPLRLVPLMFTSKKGGLFSAELGQLRVPENRTNRKSMRVTLPILKLKSRIEKPGPPIVYLADGPGVMATNEGFTLESIFQPLLRNHDIILMDQRGVGRSKPQVFWESPTSQPLDYFLSYDNMLMRDRWASEQAVARFKKQKIDFKGYSTVESADDLKDLAAALGVRQLILVGYGYGTHLALATMRRYPGLVHSAVLVGPQGPDHMLMLPSTMDQHFQNVSDLAVKDQATRIKVANLTSLTKIILRRLDRVPVGLSVRDRRTRKMVRVEVGKFGLQWIIARLLTEKRYFEELPAMLHLLAKQDYSMLRKHVERLYNETGRGISGMSYLMRLHSGATVDRLALIVRESGDSILGNAMNYPVFDVPDLWGHPDLGNSYRMQIDSNHRVLFVSGSLDPGALPSQTEEIRQGFPNGVHCVVENADHSDVLAHERTQRVILDFLVGKPVNDMRISLKPPDFLPLP